MNLPAEILDELDWKERAARHDAKLSDIVSAHLDRMSRQQKHPVIDFIFQYYRFSPGQLMRWSPGWGKVLAGAATPSLLEIKEGVQNAQGWRLNADVFPASRIDSIEWVRQLQEKVLDRAPRFSCFGLHEWAMVYRSEGIRHPQLPLRLSEDETARVVESMPISCSHYDAFRFFTPKARPLNKLQPGLDDRMEMEQCGCLHVNMDLYKWSSMFYPWVSSDLIADCFLLAYEIREIDMRASAYDCSSLGYEAVRIETEEGRAQYQTLQRAFTERAKPLRERLIAELGMLLEYRSAAA